MSFFARLRPSPAMVVAVTALVVAAGGTAWAVATVTSADIVNNTIKAKDLKTDKGVKDSKVVPDSLTGRVINESTLGNVPSATNATTAQTAATAAKLGSVTVQREEVPVLGNGNNAVSVFCPEGQQAIGGGARAIAFTTWLASSRPVPTAGGNPEDGESFTGWRAAAHNTSATADTLHVWVICAG